MLAKDESFRVRLREHLAGRVTEVVREAHAYAGEIATAIKAHKRCKGVALFVDSTEKLQSHGKMRDAVRSVFVQNGENLAIPEVHTAYMIPPWLQLLDGGALRYRVIEFPAVRIEMRPDAAGVPATERKIDLAGIALLDETIRRRMSDIEQLIAPEDLQRLYRMSGGVMRTLFQLCQEVASAARRADSLPIASSLVDDAISKVRDRYLTLTEEAVPWLTQIDETSSLDNLPEDAIKTLGDYFQAVAVVPYANGEKWYAIHPLVRERLARVHRAQPSA
jgi:hypothetical protein